MLEILRIRCIALLTLIVNTKDIFDKAVEEIPTEIDLLEMVMDCQLTPSFALIHSVEEWINLYI